MIRLNQLYHLRFAMPTLDIPRLSSLAFLQGNNGTVAGGFTRIGKVRHFELQKLQGKSFDFLCFFLRGDLKNSHQTNFFVPYHFFWPGIYINSEGLFAALVLSPRISPTPPTRLQAGTVLCFALQRSDEGKSLGWGSCTFATWLACNAMVGGWCV